MNLTLPDQLSERLAARPSAREVPRRFAPELSFGRHLGPPLPSARPATVVLLLYPNNGRWYVPLTVRPSHMTDHAGQISFPGGLVEAGETSRQAVVRELAEELDHRSSGWTTDVRLLGRLAEYYLFVSDYRVVPWVATLDRRPAWDPNPAEVAEVLEVPLTHLLDPAHTGECLRVQRTLQFTAPYFAWQNHRIWGATSVILSQLLHLVEDAGA